MSLGLPLTSLLTSVALTTVTASPLAPVAALDLPRFMGQWTHLAAIPRTSAQPCLREATTFFELNPDRSVWAMASCNTYDGVTMTTDSTGTITDPVSSAQLHMSEGLVGVKGEPNMVITFVDDTYTLAVVGHPNRSTGTVLSRTADVPATTWATVNRVVKDRGWDPCTFWTMPTEHGHQQYQPLCTVGNAMPMPGRPTPTSQPVPPMPVPTFIPPGETLPPSLPDQGSRPS